MLTQRLVDSAQAVMLLTVVTVCAVVHVCVTEAQWSSANTYQSRAGRDSRADKKCSVYGGKYRSQLLLVDQLPRGKNRQPCCSVDADFLGLATIEECRGNVRWVSENHGSSELHREMQIMLNILVF